MQFYPNAVRNDVACMRLIPISLYNLHSSHERRNPSLLCLSPQLLSCLQAGLKSEKCIHVHINSVGFAYFSHRLRCLFCWPWPNTKCSYMCQYITSRCLFRVQSKGPTWHRGKHAIIRPLPPPAARPRCVRARQRCRVSRHVSILYFPEGQYWSQPPFSAHKHATTHLFKWFAVKR